MVIMQAGFAGGKVGEKVDEGKGEWDLFVPHTPALRLVPALERREVGEGTEWRAASARAGASVGPPWETAGPGRRCATPRRGTPRHAACDAPALSRPGSNNGITGEAEAALRKDLSFIRSLDIF